MREEVHDSGSVSVDGRIRAVVREYGSVFLKGMAMGTADSVPGVSGGTIALITGIYERLITAITALDAAIVRDLLALRTREGTRTLVDDLAEKDVPFLLALGFGMTAAFVAVSGVAVWALDNARATTYAFFFGLIAASAVILYREVDVTTRERKVVAIWGFALAFWISGLSSEGLLPETPLTAFLAGVVAISAMVLPGISGSSFLILLGQYEYLIEQLQTFVRELAALLTGGSTEAIVGPGMTVASFIVGAVVGLLTITHVIKRALATYRAATLAFLVSLLAGTLRIPVIEVRDTVTTWSPLTTGAVVAAAIVGAGAVLLLDLYTDDLAY